MNNSYGILDKNGKILKKLNYSWLGTMENNRICYLDTNGYYGFLNKNGNPIIPATFESEAYFRNGHCIVLQKGFQGIIDTNGTWKVKPIYDEIALSQENGPYIFKIQKEHFYADKSLKVLKKMPNSEYLHANFGVIRTKKDEKVGLEDLNGKIILAHQYEDIILWTEKLAIVQKDKKFALLKLPSQLITQFIYEEIIPLPYSCYAFAKKDGVYIKIDREGNEMNSLAFNTINDMISNCFSVSVEKNGVSKYGVVDLNGNLMIPLEYDDMHFYAHEDKILAKKGEYWGEINFKNEITVPFEYQQLDYLNENKRVFQKDDLFGFMNNQNQVIIPTQYQDARKFAEGLAAVKINDLWGFINEQNQIQIQPQFKGISFSGFENGRAIVYNESMTKEGFIDKTGKIVIPCEYNAYPFWSYTHCEVRKDKVIYFLGRNGEIIRKIEL